MLVFFFSFGVGEMGESDTKTTPVPCPICNNPLAQLLKEDENDLSLLCKAGCKLPWVEDLNVAAKMLSKASVEGLPKFKPFTKGGAIPRCQKHEIECQLSWYKCKHFDNRKKTAEDPKGRFKTAMHAKSFLDLRPQSER